MKIRSVALLALAAALTGCPRKATTSPSASPPKPVAAVEAAPTTASSAVGSDLSGLSLDPIGDWKPRLVTERSGKSALVLERPGFPPTLRVLALARDLASLDQLEAADVLDPPVTDVVLRPRTSARGWYAAVTCGPRTVFVSVQKIGGRSFLVTGDLTKHGKDDTLTYDMAAAVADGLKAK